MFVAMLSLRTLSGSLWLWSCDANRPLHRTSSPAKPFNQLLIVAPAGLHPIQETAVLLALEEAEADLLEVPFKTSEGKWNGDRITALIYPIKTELDKLIIEREKQSRDPPIAKASLYSVFFWEQWLALDESRRNTHPDFPKASNLAFKTIELIPSEITTYPLQFDIPANFAGAVTFVTYDKTETKQTEEPINSDTALLYVPLFHYVGFCLTEPAELLTPHLDWQMHNMSTLRRTDDSDSDLELQGVTIKFVENSVWTFRIIVPEPKPIIVPKPKPSKLRRLMTKIKNKVSNWRTARRNNGDDDDSSVYSTGTTWSEDAWMGV